MAGVRMPRSTEVESQCFRCDRSGTASVRTSRSSTRPRRMVQSNGLLIPEEAAPQFRDNAAPL